MCWTGIWTRVTCAEGQILTTMLWRIPDNTDKFKLIKVKMSSERDLHSEECVISIFLHIYFTQGKKIWYMMQSHDWGWLINDRVFSCFRNSPNSHIDYRIFNMRTWSFLCIRIQTGVGHTDSESAQQFWLRKTLTIFVLCTWRGLNLGFLDLESDALPTEPSIQVMILHHHTKFHEERFRQYHPDKYSLKIWTLTVTLTLKTAI